jgi:hypothetical protein
MHPQAAGGLCQGELAAAVWLPHQSLTNPAQATQYNHNITVAAKRCTSCTRAHSLSWTIQLLPCPPGMEQTTTQVCAMVLVLTPGHLCVACQRSALCEECQFDRLMVKAC